MRWHPRILRISLLGIHINFLIEVSLLVRPRDVF
jgi:hypothetical protein